MATFRIHKTKDYTVMSNAHLKDRTMTLKAKGLLSVMLSLPDDWNYSIPGLVAICYESETAVKSALDELKKHGYLRITKLNSNQTASGRFEYVYDIFETPEQIETLDPVKPRVEKPEVENLPLENHPLYKDTKESNTKDKYINKENNIYITKESDDDIIVEDKPKKRNKAFTEPTIEELKDYIAEKKLNVDANRFFFHYESNGWMVGRTKMKDWKSALRYWDSQATPQKPAKPKEDFSRYR